MLIDQIFLYILIELDREARERDLFQRNHILVLNSLGSNKSNWDHRFKWDFFGKGICFILGIYDPRKTNVDYKTQVRFYMVSFEVIRLTFCFGVNLTFLDHNFK